MELSLLKREKAEKLGLDHQDPMEMVLAQSDPNFERELTN